MWSNLNSHTFLMGCTMVQLFRKKFTFMRNRNNFSKIIMLFYIYNSNCSLGNLVKIKENMYPQTEENTHSSYSHSSQKLKQT